MANTEPPGKEADHNSQTARVEKNTGKMESSIRMKTESQLYRSNKTNNTFAFSRPRPGKLRRTTAMLSGAVAGILLATPAVARDDDDRGTVDHVLLVSVDGMHQSDLAWYVHTHPNSTLATLRRRASTTPTRAPLSPRTRSLEWSVR
jgi:hypothetical protein